LSNTEGLPTVRERALDSLPPALYQGPSAREEVKPVVTRLVVAGAAVGSLALLAGAVMLVLRLAHPTEYPIDPSRWSVVSPGGQIRVAYEPSAGKKLARSTAPQPTTPARFERAPALSQPETPAPRPMTEPRRLAQPKESAPMPAPAAAPASPTLTPPPPAIMTPPLTAPAIAAPEPVPVAPAPAPAPARPAPQAPAPPAPEPAVRVPEPARPQEPDGTDGSAAVDWLLKGRR